MNKTSLITVWDPFVRLFHWLLVVAFFASWLTQEEYYKLHLQTGYAVLALVSLRIAMGFMGSKHARFSDFIYSPSNILTYVKSLKQAECKRYVGHNPAAGLMIITMLLALLTVTISGVALDGAENWSGPLSEMNLYRHTYLIESIHELSSDTLLILIVLHLAGVTFTSLKHRENLVKAMITGKKRADK